MTTAPGDLVSIAQFMAAVERRAMSYPIVRISEPLLRARDVILFDWPWPSAVTMYCLLRGLNGADEEFFVGEEDVFDGEGLSIASSLCEARLRGRYAEGDWTRAVDEVDELVGQIESDITRDLWSGREYPRSGSDESHNTPRADSP